MINTLPINSEEADVASIFVRVRCTAVDLLTLDQIPKVLTRFGSKVLPRFGCINPSKPNFILPPIEKYGDSVTITDVNDFCNELIRQCICLLVAT